MGQFGAPMSVKTLVNGIMAGEYYLPSIQREFVWDTDRITRLFDSLMKGYPIGSFLFWKVPEDRRKEFQFYEFIRAYHPLEKSNNSIKLTKGDRPFIAILDGQQRMTALFIGLKGSYAEKIKNKPINNKNSYIVKQLYLNLLNLLDTSSDDNELGLTYDFKFLSESQVSKLNESGTEHWFKVGDILDFSEPESVYDYVDKSVPNSLKGIALKILSTLRDRILTTTPINHYLEDNSDLSEVVNVFIRINSGGKILNPSDLLLSFATAQLQGIRDVRSDIRNFLDTINNIGEPNNFAFDKDFVLKAFLVLCDSISNIKFKVTNFDKTNMKAIHSNWDNMTEAIELAVKLIASYGFNQKNIVSTNAVIPIAHYILKKGNNPVLYKNDENIIRWFILASLGGTFRSSTDTVLGSLRNSIKEDNDSFPAQKMLKDISVDSIINGILNTTYKDKSIDMAMHILYPYKKEYNQYHIDHIFPQSQFKKKILSENNICDINFYTDNFNSFANLQLLTSSQNQSKSDKSFDKWLDETFPDKQTQDYKNYMSENCIPMNIDLSFANFKEFIQKREELIRQRLKDNLKSWNILV